MITPKQLLKHFDSKTAIAKCLGISKQAVSQWPEDSAIPQKQELRLRYELRKDIFKDKATG